MLKSPSSNHELIGADGDAQRLRREFRNVLEDLMKIYGSPRSSAGRCYLLLEELGLPYETMPLDMMGQREHKGAAFLKLNPNGKVPVLIDGDFVLWESMAINWYLADKHRPSLLGKSAQERGWIQQWTFWAITELQPPMVEMIIQLMFTPEPKRDLVAIEKAKSRVPPLLEILDQALKGQTYLVGDDFSLADINVGSIVNIAPAMGIETQPFTNLHAWYARLRERPSFRKLLEKRQS